MWYYAMNVTAYYDAGMNYAWDNSYYNHWNNWNHNYNVYGLPRAMFMLG